MDNRIKVGDWVAYGCLLFATMVSFIDSLNKIALYIAIPAAFLWSFFSYVVYKKNPYIRILSILYLWLCVCYLFAIDIDLANKELRNILGAFIFSYTAAALALRRRLLPWMYGLYISLLFFAWIYAKNHILSVIDFGEERLNDEKLNANTLAYYTFYVTIAIYMLGEILNGYLKTAFRYMLFLMAIVSFVTAIYTGSRQVLLIQVPLLCFLIWCRYLKFSSKSIMLIIGGLLLSIALYVNYGADIYENSTLKARSETAIKDDSRMRLVEESISLGLRRPLCGYGPGCIHKAITTGHGAHNTFLELLVNAGFVGFIIFSYMIYRFLKVQYKRWRYTKDRMFLAFLIFGFVWLVDQMFFSFYANLWLISFFILVATHSDLYYKGEICSRNL